MRSKSNIITWSTPMKRTAPGGGSLRSKHSKCIYHKFGLILPISNKHWRCPDLVKGQVNVVDAFIVCWIPLQWSICPHLSTKSRNPQMYNSTVLLLSFYTCTCIWNRTMYKQHKIYIPFSLTQTWTTSLYLDPKNITEYTTYMCIISERSWSFHNKGIPVESYLGNIYAFSMIYHTCMSLFG